MVRKSEEKQLEERVEELVRRIKEYDRRADVKLVREAWEFARLAHGRQRRRSGELAVAHGLAVAERLAEWKLDVATIAAGPLHETVDKGGAKNEDVVGEFGEEIARLVRRERKVAGVRLVGVREEEVVENLRQLVLSMAKDLRVVLLKLASRLHSLETLRSLPVEEGKRIGRETLEIYAPLSERMGMGEVKGVMEDLAFPFVYPKEHEWVVKEAKLYYRRADERVKEAKQKVLLALVKQGIGAGVYARKKHLYSLWKKVMRPGIDRDWERIYDIVALRILVGNVEECYAALGIIHKMWKPVVKIGVRDHIAQSKPNGYRSIHTTVFGPKGRMMEVQIRTEEMHEEAEHGMAAHWHYGGAKGKGASDEQLEKGSVAAPEEKLKWVRQLAFWQKEVVGTKEFLEAVRFDMLAKRIFVFSPKGDAFDLPVGATPVDFGYAVHTGLGRRAKGAKVNGKMVGLDHGLCSGDVVEIVRSKEDKLPSVRWLEFVKTNLARRQINKYLKRKGK